MRQIFISLIGPNMDYFLQILAPQECAFLDEIDRLIMWVNAVTIVGFISLITLVSIKSSPKELELPSSDIALSTMSGCTAERENVQVLPVIKYFSLARGSVTGGGKFSLIVLIFSRK